MVLGIDSQELINNYDAVLQPEVLEKVTDFFREHPDPSQAGQELTTLHIKMLTKIGINALPILQPGDAGSGCMDLAQSILRYCEEGIRRIESGSFRKEPFSRTPDAISVMHAHFYSHSGSLRERLARAAGSDGEKAGLLHRSIADYTRCMELCATLDAGHSARQLKSRARALRSLAKTSDDYEKYGLLLAAAEDMRAYAVRTESLGESEASAASYGFAGYILYEAARFSLAGEEKVYCLERAIGLKTKGAELCGLKPERMARAYRDIGRISAVLFSLTGKTQARRTALHYYRLALGIFEADDWCSDADLRESRSAVARLERSDGQERVPNAKKQARRRRGRAKAELQNLILREPSGRAG